MTKQRLQSHPFAPRQEEPGAGNAGRPGASGRRSVPDPQPVTTVLGKHHISWLDRLCADIYDRTGKRLNRAEVLRAFIDAATDSKLDLTNCSTEEELRATIGAALR